MYFCCLTIRGLLNHVKQYFAEDLILSSQSLDVYFLQEGDIENTAIHKYVFVLFKLYVYPRKENRFLNVTSLVNNKMNEKKIGKENSLYSEKTC